MNKKNYFKIVFFTFFICFSFIIGSSQVKTKVFSKEIPSSFLKIKNLITKEIYLPHSEDFSIRKKESELNIKSEPKYAGQFASSVQVDLDLMKLAEKNVSGNISTYAIKLIAQDALNISFEFGNFELSPNSVLSIFTNRELTDSITSLQNNESKIWATRVYQGDELFIVLTVPSQEISNVMLKIDKVNFGYIPYGAQFGSPGASSNCNVNVNCPEGNGWDNEKNSVALIVSNGNTACSGALVMNTCNTNTPYMLTANHCLTAGNVTNWVFQFQYWSNNCSTNTGWNEDIQFNGCQLKASSAVSDFLLLQLNQAPSANSGIRYAGWSRNSVAFSISQTTILHHPAGDVMKISRDNASPTIATFGGAQCWQLNINPGIGGDVGATNDHSSGGPYFDQNHRIIGQHFGIDQNNSDDCLNTNKFGGAFFASWAGGGTNATRLSNWLDPTNSGAVSTNTTNVSSLTHFNLVLSITGSSTICSGTSNYSIYVVEPVIIQ